MPRAAAIVAVLLLLAAPESAAAQLTTVDPDWSVRRWTSETGLPQNSVNDLVQTPDGFLWIATFGGLARFDGNEFEVFDVSTSPELESGRILSLHAARDGGLWIGMQSGRLLRYRDDSFSETPIGDVGEIWALEEAGDGSLWVGGARGTIRIGPDGAIEVLEPPANPAPVPTLVRVGSTIVLGRGGTVRVFPDGDPGRSTDVDAPGTVRVLLADEDGVWIGSSGGLGRIDDLADPAYRPVADSVGSVYGMARDGDLLLVAGSMLFLFDLRNGSSKNLDVQFPEELFNRFSSTLADREGSFWIGSRGNGLVQLRPATVRALGEEIPTREVYALATLPDSTVWIAACPFFHLVDASGSEPVLVRSAPVDLCVDGVGGVTENGEVYGRVTLDATEIWVGTDARPLRLGDPRIRWTGVEDGREIRLIGTGGLERRSADGLGWEPVPGAPTEPLENPHVLPSGIWAGALDGDVVRIHGGETTRWSVDEGIARGQKRWFAEDSRGDVWVAAYGGGLTRIRGEVAFTYGPESGLPETFFSAIAEEGGAIWLLGNQTLTRVELAQLDAVADGSAPRSYPAVFRQSDGFREASGADLAIDPRGRIWFGTIEGPRYVDPRNRPRNEVAAVPTVTEVRVDGVPFDPAQPIPADARELELRYTAPTFVRPSTARFRYRLRGLSDEWVDAGTRRSAFFTNLPPRDFTFEVAAINDEGIEAETAALLTLTVLPHFWETWWFRFAVLLAVVGLLWGTVATITRVERRRTLILKREIRERKRLEKERQALSEQLLRAQKLEAVGRLTGGIAHDFNNLLLVVTASLEMAREARDDRERRESVETAMSAAFRGGALTRQLLAFSRQGEVRPRALDLRRVISEMDQMLERSLGDRHPVRLDIPADLWTVLADPDGLQNAILNLVINARDAMPDGGPIVVSAENAPEWKLPTDRPGSADKDHVRVAVQDAGVGISKRDLEKIFDPFFTTKEVGKGTGLGLSMVHGFAGQAGGFVDIETELDRGTTVSIYLPRVLLDAEVAESDENRPLPEGRGETVLLVEDNARVREVTRRLLEELGYRVDDVPDAEIAWERMRHARPDVLLTDILLPGESGVDLAERVRAEHPSLPILLATGYAPDDLVQSTAHFVVLEKPFTAAALARAIHRQLTGAGRSTATGAGTD